MVLARILSQQKFVFLFSLSVITSVLVGTYTFTDLFGEIEPRQAARMAVNAMLAPYGDEPGVLAIRELKRMGAKVEAFGEDPHDTGAHMIEYVTDSGKTLRTITFRGCRSDFSRGMFLDAWANTSLSTRDLHTAFGTPDHLGRAHSGYVDRTMSILPAIIRYLSTGKDDDVILFGGHSMGGGIAMLAGWHVYRATGKRPLIFTVGVPPILSPRASRLFAEDFSGAYLAGHDPRDPIRQLDTHPVLRMFFGGYRHPEGEVVRAKSPEDSTQYFAHCLDNYGSALLCVAVKVAAAMQVVGQKRLERAFGPSAHRAKL